MFDNFNDVEKFTKIITNLVDIRFSSLAREKRILVDDVAIVVSYNSSTNKTIVYYPSDPDNNVEYINKSGVTLSAGDKVYVFHQYSNIGQGWIMVKM